mgnify:CR=1 FL=1
MKILTDVLDFFSPEQKRSFVVLLFLMLCGVFLEMLGIGLILPSVSVVLDTDSVRGYINFKETSDFEIIALFMSLLVLSFLIKTIFLVFLSWKQARFSYNTGAYLSKKLLGIYLRQPYLFHTKKNSAELIRNLTLEVNMFTQVLTALLIIITEILVVIGLIVIVLYVDPRAALSALVIFFLFGYLLEKSLRNKLSSWGVQRQEMDYERLKSIQQALGGIKTTKILAKEKEFEERYSYPNSEIAKLAIRSQTVQAFPRLWFELLAVSVLSLIIIYYSYQESNGDALFPILALFAAVAFRLLPSANRLLSSLQSLRFNMVVVSTLKKELSMHKFEELDGSSLDLPVFNILALNDVTFNYPGRKEKIINNQNFSISKGERVGIIGESGSGKSTLINLILGLIPPTEGSIYIDGNDMLTHRKAWQKRIGYVPQEVFLDDDSLIKNIAFGVKDKDIDVEKVKDCIKKARLVNFVEKLDSGLDTMVGERGSKISGGQKQRIGLARALYNSPSILILDEATSSLDNKTESGVMKSVYDLTKELTIIIVAHRISTLEGVSRLIELDNGRIIEQ